jgi:hypothetical protein
MAKKIFSSDIFGEENLFDKQYKGALQLEKALDGVISNIRTMASVTGATLKDANVNNAGGVEKLGRSYNEATMEAKLLKQAEEDLIKTRAKINISNQEVITELTQVRKEYQLLMAEKRAKARVDNDEIGAYQKLTNAMQLAARQMKNLFVEGKQNEEQFKRLSAEYSKLYEQALAADKSVGQYQRNVGNYNMENQRHAYSLFQVTQVLREMPNFAQSATIGIRSLGNNIPMLTAELTRMAKSVDENTGKVFGWKNTMKAVVGEIFGWQSAIILLITVFTIFAKEIGEWTSSVFGARKELSALKDIQKQIAEVGQENLHNYAKERAEITLLVGVLKSENTTKEEKYKATKRLNEISPEYLGNISAETINTDEATDAIARYIVHIERLAKAKAVFDKYSELEKIIVDTQTIDTNVRNREALKKLVGEDYEEIAYENAKVSAEARGNMEGEKGWKFQAEYNHYIQLALAAKRAAAIYEQKTLNDFLNKSGLIGELGSDKKISGGGIKGGASGKGSGGADEPKYANGDMDKAFQSWRTQMETEANNLLLNQRMTAQEHSRVMIQIELEYLERTKQLYIEYGKPILEIEKKISEAKLRMLNPGSESKPDKPEKPAKVDDMGKNLKDSATNLMKLAQTIDKVVNDWERAQQQRLQHQMDITKRKQEDLRMLAAQGVKDAKDNLAFEEKKQAELQQKQERLQRAAVYRQTALAALQTYNNKIQAGDPNALGHTLTDIAALLAFVAFTPGFIEGTEKGTVADNLGNPQLKGRDGYMIRVDGKEKIFNPEHTEMIGDMTNSEVAQLAFLYRSGMSPVNVDARSTAKNDDVVQELREVKKAIAEQRPPQMMWNDTDKAMEYKYNQGNKMVREIHKTSGIWSDR